jgi:hypothetical protein
MADRRASGSLASIRTDLRRIEIVLSARIHRIELNPAATGELLERVREALSGIDGRLASLDRALAARSGSGSEPRE